MDESDTLSAEKHLRHGGVALIYEIIVIDFRLFSVWVPAA